MFLKYVLLFIPIYFFLRYINLSISYSIIISIFTIMVLLIIELCIKMNQSTPIKDDNLWEHFVAPKEDCPTCNTDKKCRVVCDTDPVTPSTDPSTPPPPPQTTASSFGGMYNDENPYYNRYNDGVNRDNYDLDEKLRQIDTSGYKSRYQTVGSKSEYNKSPENSRRILGELDNEMPYTDYNHLPVAAGYKSRDYEYGYSFIPPEKWYPQPPRAPICVTNDRAPIFASLADGTPTDVKEFDSSRRITGPLMINTDYVKEKLNSDR